MIGFHKKKIIDVKVLSEICSTCLCKIRIGEVFLKYDFTKKYEASRKGMETMLGLELVK